MSFPFFLSFEIVLGVNWLPYFVILLVICCFKVLVAEEKYVENAIRCGGFAPTKASCVKSILSYLHRSKGKLCLE